MNEEEAKTFLKLAPFDTSTTDHLSMYDQLPYVRNPDECNGPVLSASTGNILKFYRCSVKDGSYQVSNQDEQTAVMLDKLRKEQALSPKVEPAQKKHKKPSITEEQVDELLREPEQEPEPVTPIPVTFDDDW